MQHNCLTRGSITYLIPGRSCKGTALKQSTDCSTINTPPPRMNAGQREGAGSNVPQVQSHPQKRGNGVTNGSRAASVEGVGGCLSTAAAIRKPIETKGRSEECAGGCESDPQEWANSAGNTIVLNIINHSK